MERVGEIYPVSRPTKEGYLRAFNKGTHFVLGARPGHAFPGEAERLLGLLKTQSKANQEHLMLV